MMGLYLSRQGLNNISPGHGPGYLASIIRYPGSNPSESYRRVRLPGFIQTPHIGIGFGIGIEKHT